MKKFWKVLLIVLGCIIALQLIMTIVNLICSRREKPSIADYGTKVDVFGETMNVGIFGSGEDVIVILPGSGDPAPVLDFRQLAELMAGECTVIVPEPFGYGLSDITDRPRTFDNEAEELHECLSKLGYSSYTLMGHSLSGLTMLQYTNLYPDEVRAVVALDTSVPKQVDSKMITAINRILAPCVRFIRVTGTFRLLSFFGNFGTNVIGGSVSEAEADTLQYIVCSSLYNRNVVEEINGFPAEGERMYDMQYPESIPVLTFLAEDNAGKLPEWTLWHEEISENENSRLYTLSGGHYVYRYHAEEIAAKALEFIGK